MPSYLTCDLFSDLFPYLLYEITYIIKCLCTLETPKQLWLVIEKFGGGCCCYWKTLSSPEAVSIQRRQRSASLPPFSLLRKHLFSSERGSYLYLYLVLYAIFSEKRLTEVLCARVSSQVPARAWHVLCLPCTHHAAEH